MAMPSKWALFGERSLQVARDATAAVLRMDPGASNLGPKTLFAFRSSADIAQHVVGCDADIGGYSTAKLDLDATSRGRFSGVLRTDIKPSLQQKMRSGYAGFRNKMRPSLFGNITDDLSLYKYLALRVRASGDPRTRDGYFVNIQTDGPIEADLWQHRLYLRGEDEWETVMVPLDKFVLTNAGETVNTDLVMTREAVRSVGISLLSRNANTKGNFELGIESIEATNDNDVATSLVDT